MKRLALSLVIYFFIITFSEAVDKIVTELVLSSGEPLKLINEKIQSDNNGGKSQLVGNSVAKPSSTIEKEMLRYEKVEKNEPVTNRVKNFNQMATSTKMKTEVKSSNPMTLDSEGTHEKLEKKVPDNYLADFGLTNEEPIIQKPPIGFVQKKSLWRELFEQPSNDRMSPLYDISSRQRYVSQPIGKQCEDSDDGINLTRRDMVNRRQNIHRIRKLLPEIHPKPTRIVSILFPEHITESLEVNTIPTPSPLPPRIETTTQSSAHVQKQREVEEGFFQWPPSWWTKFTNLFGVSNTEGIPDASIDNTFPTTTVTTTTSTTTTTTTTSTFAPLPEIPPQISPILRNIPLLLPLPRHHQFHFVPSNIFLKDFNSNRMIFPVNIQPENTKINEFRFQSLIPVEQMTNPEKSPKGYSSSSFEGSKGPFLANFKKSNENFLKIIS